MFGGSKTIGEAFFHLASKLTPFASDAIHSLINLIVSRQQKVKKSIKNENERKTKMTSCVFFNNSDAQAP